jgi:hypothetical protein
LKWGQKKRRETKWLKDTPKRSAEIMELFASFLFGEEVSVGGRVIPAQFQIVTLPCKCRELAKKDRILCASLFVKLIPPEQPSRRVCMTMKQNNSVINWFGLGK